ncbi:MAG TPA: VOC family protein [Candidatus Acidoferrum sp.]|nr:VOC family protein [Candidatus Acidoferrum sp.]
MNEATAPATRSPGAAPFRRPGFNNIAPYFLVNGAAKFMEFLVTAFEATERIRVPRPDGSIMHAEVGIGDADVIELGDANEHYPTRPMATHLYVPDAHAAYGRALHAGATSIHPPNDEHPSGDRWGAIIDPFGNTWFIATRRGWVPGPEGMRTVQPYLHVREAHKMIPFVEAALGAKADGVATSTEGVILHATIEIAGATFELAEAQGESEPTPAYLHVYVPDTDAVYAQAVRAEATGVTPPANAPYGDRAATVRDPFGNTWFLATYLGTNAPQA